MIAVPKTNPKNAHSIFRPSSRTLAKLLSEAPVATTSEERNAIGPPTSWANCGTAIASVRMMALNASTCGQSPWVGDASKVGLAKNQ